MPILKVIYKVPFFIFFLIVIRYNVNSLFSVKHQHQCFLLIIFATPGSILLWLYWPSFNALLASDDARHRAYINTYISLLAATVCTFIASTIFGSGRRFQAVDVQNATLAGGAFHRSIINEHILQERDMTCLIRRSDCWSHC